MDEKEDASTVFRTTARPQQEHNGTSSAGVSVEYSEMLGMITFGVVAVVVGLIIGAVFFVRRVRRTQRLKLLHTDLLTPNRTSTSSQLQTTAFTPPETVELITPEVIPPLSDPAEKLAYDTKFELSMSWLRLVDSHSIAEGDFSRVVVGLLQLPTSEGEEVKAVKVAVKSPKERGRLHNELAMLKELRILSNLDYHPNVLGLAGAVTERIDRGELYVVTQYCHNGVLLDYLQGNEERFVNLLLTTTRSAESGMNKKGWKVQRKASTHSRVRDTYDTEKANRHLGTAKDSLTTSHLLSFCYQAADAMNFLSHNLIHRNLSAQNALVTDQLVLKLTGLSDTKSKQGYSDLWRPPEVRKEGKFSVQSDVWSFGLFLWEVFSFDSPQYTEKTFPYLLLFKMIKCLQRPRLASEAMCELMQKCWALEARDRVSFDTLRTNIRSELEKCSQKNFGSNLQCLDSEVARDNQSIINASRRELVARI